MKKDQQLGAAGSAPGRLVADPSAGSSPRKALLSALAAVGLDPEAAAVFGDAAVALGAVSRGRRLGEVELGPRRTGGEPAPGSMEAHLRAADVALAAAEAITSCQARLDAALVLTTAAQTTSIGAALLAQRDLAGPDELSATARTRWRGMAKRRASQELTAAIGTTPGEAAHLVALACAPVAFSVPVVAQMGRGQLPWRLARTLWRACEGLDPEDAAHVATVLCGDEPTSCVPERLTPDGEVTAAPWGHRAFYSALDREVAKVTHADDADPADLLAQREARDAALAGRRVMASVEEDGTGSITLITSALWVAGIKDRLAKAARVARAKGDARTVDQLESDIARALLAHSTLGVAELPVPEVPEGQEITPEHLARAGWTPELVATLSGLPPAVLQVVVPLIGLHDPATAGTLPVVGRVVTHPEPAVAEHTGRPGCPSCAPGLRAANAPPDGPPPGPAVPQTRRLWVGELLGAFGMFVSPAQVRELALSPGTTMARLLADPADGRCVERSSGSYLMDAAMRAQILAADVTCRAPGCIHHGAACEVDHVLEHGVGGATSERNGQLLHTGHHEPKTAKHWDAELAANRDVRWTSLLGRIYTTRGFDYRRHVTLVASALDAVSGVPEEDRDDEINRQIYLALTHRHLAERLRAADDDPTADIDEPDRWPPVGLMHRDRRTGRRTSGPPPDASAPPPQPRRPRIDPGPAPAPATWPTPDPAAGRLCPPPGVSMADWERQIEERRARGEDPPPF